MGTGTIFDQFRRLASWTCLVVGICFVVLATGFAIDTEIFLHRSVAGTARIVSLVSSHNKDDNSVSFAPVFTFATLDGQMHTVTSNVSSNPAGFAVGQEVPIRYEPEQPSGAKIASFWQLWLFPFVFGLLGLTATGAGYGLWRYQRSRDRKVSPASLGDQSSRTR